MARFVRSLLLLTGRCACSFAYAVEPGVNNPLLSELRPWCIGRLMFDRPVSSEISDERYEYRGEKLETTHDVSAEDYDAKVAAREKELRTKQRVNPVDLQEQTGRMSLKRPSLRCRTHGFSSSTMRW